MKPSKIALCLFFRILRPDAAKGKTSYTYDAFNKLRTTTDPGGATTTWTLDALGHARRIVDPDRGVTDMIHDGFGDLVSSTDALGRTVTWTHDALGRPDTRTDAHLGKTLTTKWTWDTAPNGIGTRMGLKPHAIQSKSARSADFAGSIRSAIAIHDESKTMGREWR